MKINLIFCLCAGILLAGCAKTRSISNSAYQKDVRSAYYCPPPNDSDPAFAYRGELSEFDVLGVVRGESISEEEIGRALDNAKQVRLRPGGSLLVVQSGAMFPDNVMVAELGRHFTVVPFSGVPPAPKRTGAVPSQIPMAEHGTTRLQVEVPNDRAAGLRLEVPGHEGIQPPPGARIYTTAPPPDREAESFAKSLRLAAARSGSDTILCYWGILESEKANLPTKTVSWVPVVNWLLPDEAQRMRIRLKVALIDVRSGSWTVFTPNAFQEESISRSPLRAAADQKQVESLKQKAYEAAVNDLVSRYADHLHARVP